MSKTQKILIVEPDEDIREWMAAGLAREGYAVWKADQPLMALAILQEHIPDCVVLSYPKIVDHAYQSLLDAMRNTTQLWLLDTLPTNFVAFIENSWQHIFPDGLMRKETLTAADRQRLRAETARYRSAS